MLVNNIYNKSLIQKLKINYLETALISNAEFNTLNGINTTITIQEQINNLVESGSSGIIDYITTKSIYLNQNLIDINPLILSDGTITYFKITNSGSIYGTNLYMNNILIDFASYATREYVINNYPSLTYLNGYRTIADSWSRSDTTNEIEIRTGYTDDSTCKSHDDDLQKNIDDANTSINDLWIDVDALDIDVGVLDVTVTGIAADVAALDVTVTGLVVDLAVVDADLVGINTDIAALDTTVAEHTANLETLDAKTIYMNAGTGAEGTYTNFSGSVNTTNINPTVSLLNIGTSTFSLNTINIGTIGSVITIGGVIYSPFNQMNGFIQW